MKLLAALLFTLSLSAGPLENLRAYLKSIEGERFLRAAHYSKIESLLLPWLEAELRSGATPILIEQKLRAASLLAENHQTVGMPLRLQDRDLGDNQVAALTIELRFVLGEDPSEPACSALYPTLIYQRSPYRRLHFYRPNLALNSPPLYPADILLTQQEPVGERWLVSTWSISWCTSTITSGYLFAHRIGKSASVLRWRKVLHARHWEDNFLHAVQQGNRIYFPFHRQIPDDAAFAAEDVYGIELNGPQLKDVSPPAGSIAAFLARHLESIRKKGASKDFSWVSIDPCPSPGVWQLGIKRSSRSAPTFYRIAAPDADSLRLLAATAEPACPQGGVEQLISILSLLPPYAALTAAPSPSTTPSTPPDRR